MKKLVLYSGGATTALLIAYWLGRRSKSASSLGGSGLGLYSAVDYTVLMPQLALKAEKQVVKAGAGSWIDDYRKVQDRSSFQEAPAYNAQAYYAAGYWTAVAARLLKSRSLAMTAQGLVTRGNVMYNIPFSSQLVGSASSIMTAAAAVVEQAGAGDKNVAAVVAAMRQTGSHAAVEAAKKRIADKAVMWNTAKQNAVDAWALPQPFLDTVSGPLSWVRAAAGINNPDGTPAPWYKRWLPRLAVGGLVALGLRVYFAPEIAAVRVAVTKQIAMTPRTAEPEKVAS